MKEMGEVRVKVRIINAIDEGLARRGKLSEDQIRSQEVIAITDGLFLVRKARATYANSSSENVDVKEAVGIEILGRRVTEETLVLGDEVLIGQTALERTDLLVDRVNKRVIPNPAHPDQPVIKIK